MPRIIPLLAVSSPRSIRQTATLLRTLQERQPHHSQYPRQRFRSGRILRHAYRPTATRRLLCTCPRQPRHRHIGSFCATETAVPSWSLWTFVCTASAESLAVQPSSTLPNTFHPVWSSPCPTRKPCSAGHRSCRPFWADRLDWCARSG